MPINKLSWEDVTVARHRALAIASMSVALSAWLIGSQVLHAAWGIIDDHEIFTMMGPGNHHLPLGQYFYVMLTKTELGSIGQNLRFRPFYYSAYLGEQLLWGDNVHLWYACNVALLATFIAGIWIVIARHLGLIVGLAIVLVVMRAAFWGDVWARLGDGEIYGAAGLGFWIAGINGMFANAAESSLGRSMFAVSFGTIMMVGSKETLFPFAGYSVCAFALFIYLNRNSLAGKIHLAVMIIYSVATATVIGLAMARAGQDYLGRPAGLTERLAQLAMPFAASLEIFILPAVLLLGLTVALVRWRAFGRDDLAKAWTLPAVTFAASVMVLWSLYLSQYVGYNGQWPTGYRYDFPGMLAIPAMIVVSVAFLIAISKPWPSINLVIRGGVMTVAIVSIFLSLRAAPFPLARAAADNNFRTTEFQKTLAELAKLASKDPQEPIILRANGAWSAEKTISVAIYLHNRYGVANPIALRFYSDGNPDPRYVAIGKALESWEQDGRAGQFVPLGSTAERAKTGCLSMGLDGAPEPGCRGGFTM